jgi:VWFA-related protein
MGQLTMRRVPSLLCCFLLWGASALAGQTSSPKAPGEGEAAATIKTTSRVVLLSVVVTDMAGKPVHGLKAQDFTVVEDSKPQQVRGFEERGPDTGVAGHPVAVNLPPNTYTNFASSSEPGAINILLFDRLNTEGQNIAKARQQMLLYLSKLPANSRIALFTLDWELHLVHGFTDDSRELIEAAQQLSASTHPMFSNAVGVSDAIAMVNDAGVAANPKMYASLVTFLWAEHDSKAESRTLVTMQALNQLARSMAVYPGRKNLIWISGGLPFDPTSTDPQLRKTATLLAATQMAVYPIDVSGVKVMEAEASTRDSAAFGLTESFETTSGQGQELHSLRETMINLATLTGGHAYYNRNDLQAAISDSVNAGSNYYTLAYRPENNNWNGKFRKITVKASPPNVKIQCRPGYYAVADPLRSPDIDRTFLQAMQPAGPASTTLIMKAQVLPPEEPNKATQIDFLLDMHDLALTDSAAGRAPDVLFVAAAWDAKGKPGGSVSATYRQALNPAELQSLMRTGLQLHQEMQLSPGKYQLRLGVLDRVSGKMGTLDVPLTVESKTVESKMEKK